MEKVRASSIVDQGRYKAKLASFHKFMRFLVVSIGVVIPVVSGYWRYSMTSDPDPLLSGIFFGVICTFFSLGLWLSVTKFGQRFKWMTLFLLLIGVPLHIQDSSYPFYFLPVFVLAEFYALYSLFRKMPV
jgi:hypothetical protein